METIALHSNPPVPVSNTSSPYSALAKNTKPVSLFYLFWMICNILIFPSFASIFILSPISSYFLIVPISSLSHSLYYPPEVSKTKTSCTMAKYFPLCTAYTIAPPFFSGKVKGLHFGLFFFCYFIFAGLANLFVYSAKDSHSQTDRCSRRRNFLTAL